MTIETFVSTITKRFLDKGIDYWEPSTRELCNEINRMTGGSFYASVEKLPEDWEFPE